jgi:hypothetical protein
MHLVRDLGEDARIGILVDRGGSWAEALALAEELRAEAMHPERTLAKPAARVVLFSDVARADLRERLSLANPLASVGVGVSFLDGLFRIDLARAIKTPTGWRLDIYSDAAL